MAGTRTELLRELGEFKLLLHQTLKGFFVQLFSWYQTLARPCPITTMLGIFIGSGPAQH